MLCRLGIMPLMKTRDRYLAYTALGALALGFYSMVVMSVLDESLEEASVRPAPPVEILPPVAERRPHTIEIHGQTISDDWAWLADASYPIVDDPDVLTYLAAENAYRDRIMEPHEKLVETIFDELVGRVEQDDSSVPVKDGPWLYGWRYEPQAQYRLWVRRPVVGGEEVVVLDETSRAAGKQFWSLGGIEVSPDHGMVAFSEDLDGAERFTMRVRRISTGEVLLDEVAGTIDDPVWAADAGGFFYARLDENWRPYQARYHRLGTPAGEDAVVYEEPDPGFFVSIGKTQDRRWITIVTADSITSEVHLVPADAPLTPPLLVAARRSGHEYYLDHAGDEFFVLTNDVHPNFRVATAPDAEPGAWTEVLPPSDRTYYRGLTAFSGFVAIEERTDGLDQIRVLAPDGASHLVPFTEPAYSASLGDTREADVRTFRIDYESMVTPDTVYDYDISTRTLTSLDVQEIPSGYDASRYVTERLWATARDNTRVPVTVLYEKGYEKDGRGLLHVYGYGAYGIGMPPGFSASRLSLVDRGFAYAIAHVRGGDEMGRRWYEDGRLFARVNTFTDFVDVARFLVEQGFGEPGRVSISGASAGGSLVGYVVNSDPDLWGAAVAHVPFVDILNTMLDADLPLTPIEWPIWGNPVESREAFDNIRSYSPYDNVGAHAYPPMLVTAGINDPRVTYWEPAKWVARLRATRTDDELLLLHTNMGAGHAGKSGRFEHLRETAEEYAFILVALGLVH